MENLPAIRDSARKLPGYMELFKKVRDTFLIGQREIERTKIKIYWHTGVLINKHVRHYGSRYRSYGSQVINKLAEDMDVEKSQLWRCCQIAVFLNILAARRESLPDNLTWSHYRKIIVLPDDETRIEFMKRAAKHSWTTRELERHIQMELKFEASKSGRVPAGLARPLEPKLGERFTYVVVPPDADCADEGNWIDLGFGKTTGIPENAADFEAGAIVEGVRKGKRFYVRATKRSKEALYTYKGILRKVVDGDTLRVNVDFGFKIRDKHYLRLRGIDCAEENTPAGKKAQEFAARELADCKYVIFTSSGIDDHGRSIADVYYGTGMKCLNKVLLDKGYAIRMNDDGEFD